MFASFPSWAASGAAAILAKVALPAYKPHLLAPDGEGAVDALKVEYQRAIQQGNLAALKLLASTVESRKNRRRAKVSKTLNQVEVQQNLKSIGLTFDGFANVSDPDSLSVKIVETFCIGVEGLRDLDNRRRVVAAWSAVLAPSVVMQRKSNKMITLQSVVDAGADWMQFGFTTDAKSCYEKRDTRFVCRHPARMYGLLSDAASAHKLDHMELMASVVRPVVLAIGQYQGAQEALAQLDQARQSKVGGGCV